MGVCWFDLLLAKNLDLTVLVTHDLRRIRAVMMASTGQGIYTILEHIHALRGFETAFHQATGLHLQLRPLPPQAQALLIEPEDNPLCLLACSTVTGRALCHKLQSNLRRRFAVETRTQKMSCLAGLVVIAVPVVVSGQHVSNLQTCRLFLRPPDSADIARFAELLEGWGVSSDVETLKRHFASIPVASPKQLDAILHLLGLYADHLGDLATRRLLAEQQGRPSPLTQVLAFVRENQTTRLHLRDVAEKANLSPYYFCKLFRKTMGMTFMDYLTRLRMENAKDLLLNPHTPVGEVAVAAGFGSIPHFNRAFKRYTGLTPTLYRAQYTGAARSRSSPPKRSSPGNPNLGRKYRPV